MTDECELLRRTAELAAEFLDTLDERDLFTEAKGGRPRPGAYTR